MIKTLSVVLILEIIFLPASVQYNCNVFKLENNEKCYEACLLATEAEQLQGTRQSQEKFDQAISLCPTFAYAYFEKSVPYLKRGDLKTWRAIIDKAVEHDRLYLGYRGWCRFQFARDYQGALDDFTALRKHVGENLGYSQNGDYDLRVVEALCYDQLGDTKTAIETLERFTNPNPTPGSYALLHLGVMMINQGRFAHAVPVLAKAIAEDTNLADSHFYYASALQRTGKTSDALMAVEKAIELYEKGYHRKDAYTNPVHRIYRSNIDLLKAELLQK